MAATAAVVAIAAEVMTLEVAMEAALEVDSEEVSEVVMMTTTAEMEAAMEVDLGAGMETWEEATEAAMILEEDMAAVAAADMVVVSAAATET